MNAKFRTEGKHDFEKDFFKLMNNSFFGETMENVRKHRYIKLVTTNKKKSRLASEPNDHREFFSNGNEKKVKIVKAVCLGLSILETSKTMMYEFWQDYVKPKYQQNAKLRYVDTDGFIIHTEIEDVYEHIANDVEKNIWYFKL